MHNGSVMWSACRGLAPFEEKEDEFVPLILVAVVQLINEHTMFAPDKQNSSLPCGIMFALHPASVRHDFFSTIHAPLLLGKTTVRSMQGALKASAATAAAPASAAPSQRLPAIALRNFAV